MANKPRIRFRGFTEDWEQRKLGDVADVRDGTHDSPKFYNDGFPLVTSKNLKDGSIDFSDCSFISKQDFDEINKRSKVDSGDILFGMIGTIGNPAIVEHTGFAIKNVALIKEGIIVNNRFIYHLLSSKVFDNYIARENAGGTQKFIALNQIRNFIFLAPTLEEQNKIIELLDYISQTITLHQCKLKKLNLAKKSLLQKLFPRNGSQIPGVRFKGFTDAWEQRKLGDLLILLKDGSHGTHKNTDEGVYLLSAKNIKNGRINIMSDDRIISWDDYNVIHKNYELQIGDILLTIVGSIGETAIFNLKTKVTFQRSVAFLRPNSNLNNGFLYTLINTDRFQNQLQTKQVVSAQPGIYLGDLATIDITYPKNILEQEKIYNIFKEIEKSITLHQRKLERLQEVKKGLLQKMFV